MADSIYRIQLCWVMFLSVCKNLVFASDKKLIHNLEPGFFQCLFYAVSMFFVSSFKIHMKEATVYVGVGISSFMMNTYNIAAIRSYNVWNKF